MNGYQAKQELWSDNNWTAKKSLVLIHPSHSHLMQVRLIRLLLTSLMVVRLVESESETDTTVHLGCFSSIVENTFNSRVSISINK